MPALDLEAEYNNRQRVPEHGEIIARWLSASAAARASLGGERDVPYGTGERLRYDLFHARGTAAANLPLVVYIHGGYWQSRHGHDFAFVAPALVANGLAVALPSYNLCPAVSVGDIIAEMQSFLIALWGRTRQRPVVVGHSAGGHLAAAMLATDWSKAGSGVPADLVRVAYAISGVFELEPLIPTSLNAALRLDADTARQWSPLLWPAPAKDRTLVAAVGANESQEFIRQSLDMAAAWSGSGVKAECVVVPAANHFTIVDELARPESAMIARIGLLARTTLRERID
jgi:arylformamidase